MLKKHRIKTFTDSRGINVSEYGFDLEGNTIFKSQKNLKAESGEICYYFYEDSQLVKDSVINYFGQNDSSISITIYSFDEKDRIITEKRWHKSDTVTLTYEHFCTPDSSFCETKAYSNGKLWYTQTDSTNGLIKTSIFKTDGNWGRTSVATYDDKGNLLISDFYYGSYLQRRSEYNYNSNSQVIKARNITYYTNEKQKPESEETKYFQHNENGVLIEENVIDMDNKIINKIEYVYFDDGLIKTKISTSADATSKIEYSYTFYD